MRVVVTGTNPRGRSYAHTVEEYTGLPTQETTHEIFKGPLTIGPTDTGSSGFMDLSPGPGAALWRVFEFPPGSFYDMHHTQTVDLDVVVDGSVVLGLDEGDVELLPGDCVLIRGDRHSWRAGGNGCRMLFALLGTESRQVADLQAG